MAGPDSPSTDELLAAAGTALGRRAWAEAAEPYGRLPAIEESAPALAGVSAAPRSRLRA